MFISLVNWIHLILALCLMAIGLAMVFDALSSHVFEWPLGLFALILGGAAILTLLLRPQNPP